MNESIWLLPATLWFAVATMFRDLGTLACIAVGWCIAMLWLVAFEDAAPAGGRG